MCGQDPNSSTVVKKWFWGKWKRRGIRWPQKILWYNYSSIFQVSANPLDGCTHVFIDIGSNKGLQIQKLFEPQLFQRDPVLPIFQRWHRWCFVKFYGFTLLFLKDIFWCRYFGPPEKRLRDHICAVGFYPKEIIDQPEGPLIDLRNNYLTCGIKVILFLKIPAQLEYWYNFRCW